MILGLQITGVIFSLIMIYFALIHYKKGSLNGLEMGVWLVIWLTVIAISIFPEIFRVYSRAIAVSRLLDLLIAGGFVLVITMVASAYIRTNLLEKKFEAFIRNNSLKSLKLKLKRLK